MSNGIVRLAVVWTSVVGLQTALADYKDDIGHTALKAELGSATPDGTGVGVSMAEANWDGVSGRYRPDPNLPEFSGKTITLKSGAGSASIHADEVGRHLFGSNSIASGVTQIDVYSSSGYRGSDLLNDGSLSAPGVEIRQVQNHSWISSNEDSGVLRRLDYAINRDGFTATVGVNNWVSGNAPSHPPLLSNAYNAIAVGLTSGAHSRGTTTTEGSGRVKPDIVAPSSAVSFATPMVGAAAAVLRQAAGNAASPVNARQPETIKALLMAGATKSEFPSWDRTQTRPLDEVYGAGELNIQRSYHTLAAGEHNASSNSTVATRGWDFGLTTASDSLYFFDVAPNTELTELSVLLTWNRTISASGTFGWLSPSASLANLDLRLYSATDFSLGSLLDASLSTVDNVEHLYLADGLSAGRYALSVSSGTTNHEYALAWYSEMIAIPEPGSATLAFLAVTVLLRHRRRRR